MPIQSLAALTVKDYRKAKAAGAIRLANTFKKIMLDQGINPREFNETPRQLKVLPEEVWTAAVLVSDFMDIAGGSKVYITKNVELPSPSIPSWWVVSPNYKVTNVAESLLMEVVRIVKKNGKPVMASPKSALALDKYLNKNIRKIAKARMEMNQRISAMQKKLPRVEGWDYRKFTGKILILNRIKGKQLRLKAGEIIALKDNLLAVESDEGQVPFKLRPETLKKIIKSSTRVKR